MTQNSNDLRARRTRKLMRDALLELIEERGFDATTVEELTERAMVSRSAFYRYYQDKYDLAEQIFEEAMSTLLNAVGEMGPERPPQVWVKFFEHIAEYERFAAPAVYSGYLPPAAGLPGACGQGTTPASRP